jgi:uncharacterized protein
MPGIIDCDVHPYASGPTDIIPYMPRAWQERFTAQKFEMSGRSVHRYPHPVGGSLRTDAVPPGGGLAGSDPQYMIEHLIDRYDVSAALMIPIQACAVSAWTDADRSAVFVEAFNRYVVEQWASVDPRFRLCVTVSPHDTIGAAKEIRRLKDESSLAGISIPLLDTMLGNRHYYPIYEVAQELDLPIIIHPTGAEGSYLGAPQIAGGIPRTYAERHALFPQGAQANLSSLVFEGVFERYPGLKVMFTEWGFSWLGTFMWRLDAEWRNFRSDVPWVKKPPSEYIKQSVTFSTQPIDEPALAEDLWPILDLMGADRTLVFSSDYPHYDNDDPQIVSARLLPARYRDAVMHDTAKAFFNGRL